MCSTVQEVCPRGHTRGTLSIFIVQSLTLCPRYYSLSTSRTVTALLSLQAVMQFEQYISLVFKFAFSLTIESHRARDEVTAAPHSAFGAMTCKPVVQLSRLKLSLLKTSQGKACHAN